MTCLGNFLLFTFFKANFTVCDINNSKWWLRGSQGMTIFLSFHIHCCCFFLPLFFFFTSSTCLFGYTHSWMCNKDFPLIFPLVCFSLKATKLLFLSVFMLKYKKDSSLCYAFILLYLHHIAVHTLYGCKILSWTRWCYSIFCKEVNGSTISLNIADF